MAATHRDKGGKQTAGARSDLSPVALGPSLGLLAAQDSSGNVGEVSRAAWDVVDVRPPLSLLGHTGYR